ncbi:head completion/stabilization protein [Serratia ureilytica]|uniref:Head completion/stabilization protein n=1 Tax=Serratia ureilytica TaxID=300181 RepID=A0A9X9G1A3_9GAMM|nr:head completion/stabilization protein [Serratia ureilytica]TXE26923.1 head completion/stabilization protein [Serratia ureilytica]
MESTTIQLNTAQPDTAGPEIAPVKPPEIVTNDGFWPDVDAGQYRQTVRQDGDMPAVRLREALLQGINDANKALQAWKALQVSLGYTTLEQVPAEQVSGESVQVQRYRRAVFAFARAVITEQFRGTDTTHSGEQRAKTLDTTLGELWRTADWAINDILGIPRVTVDLV